MSLHSNIAPYAKAITGAVIAGLGTLGAALTPDESGLVSVNPGEWVAITTAFLTASLLVWAVPNKDPESEHQDESVQPSDEVKAEIQVNRALERTPQNDERGDLGDYA